MARAPYRLPIPLSGSSDGGTTGAEVNPIAQWTELPRSGAALPATAIPLTMPGVYYETTAATGVASRLWVRREAGDESQPLTGTVFLNGVDTGATVTIAGGETQAQESISVSVADGDLVRVYVTGGDNTAEVSGLLATPTRLFRLLRAPIGLVWVMTDGEWVTPPNAYLEGAGWDVADSAHLWDGADWRKVL